ncbi:MAG: hypothetical protein RRZ66_12205 [Bacteroidales bacterium]
MKRNAIVWGLISLLIGLTAFWACDDNDDDDRDRIYQSFAMVQLDEANNTFTLKTEKGNTLTPTNASVYVSKVVNGEWVIATFKDVVGTAPALSVYLLNLEKVLTKPVWDMTVDNVDSVVVKKRDPGYIDRAWVVTNGDLGYINILFHSFWMSEPIFVNLVQNNTMVVDESAEAKAVPAVKKDTVPSDLPNPNAGVWTLDFITTYQGALILPPQRANGIASFTVPATKLAGITKIVINYTDFNNVLKQYTVPVSTASTYVATEFDASTPIKEQVLQIE